MGEMTGWELVTYPAIVARCCGLVCDAGIGRILEYGRGGFGIGFGGLV